MNLRADKTALFPIALGGSAFALYSIGFVYGRVAIVILLYFLTPVWSSLIGRHIIGWYAPRSRLLAIFDGLVGLGAMLSADGDWPMPRGTGEWIALVAGLLWSASQPAYAFNLFRNRLRRPLCGIRALLKALILAPLLEPGSGVLVLSAGVLDVWPVRQTGPVCSGSVPARDRN